MVKGWIEVQHFRWQDCGPAGHRGHESPVLRISRLFWRFPGGRFAGPRRSGCGCALRRPGAHGSANGLRSCRRCWTPAEGESPDTPPTRRRTCSWTPTEAVFRDGSALLNRAELTNLPHRSQEVRAAGAGSIWWPCRSGPQPLGTGAGLDRKPRREPGESQVRLWQATAAEDGQWRVFAPEHVTASPPVRRALRAVAESRCADRRGSGIWARGGRGAARFFRQPRRSRSTASAGRYVIARGRIVSLGKTRRTRYLNFGKYWKTDLTGHAEDPRTKTGSTRRWAVTAGGSLDALAGPRLSNCAVSCRKDGPLIALRHPEQLVVLNAKGQDVAAKATTDFRRTGGPRGQLAARPRRKRQPARPGWQVRRCPGGMACRRAVACAVDLLSAAR